MAIPASIDPSSIVATNHLHSHERARFDMIKRASDFGLANAADFTTPVPPAVTVSAAQTKSPTLFAALNTAYTGRLVHGQPRRASGEGEAEADAYPAENFLDRADLIHLNPLFDSNLNRYAKLLHHR